MYTYGEDITVAYDIGCAFSKTIPSGSLAQRHVTFNSTSSFLPVFHGYAHSRDCQLNRHPVYIQLRWEWERRHRRLRVRVLIVKCASVFDKVILNISSVSSDRGTYRLLDRWKKFIARQVIISQPHHNYSSSEGIFIYQNASQVLKIIEENTR